MACKHIDPRGVKLHRSYTVSEAAQALGCHKNTVREWIRAGLETIHDRKPLLIKGAILRTFLESRSKNRKRPCGSGETYCLKCRAPRKPVPGTVEFHSFNPKAGNLSGTCVKCGTKMYRGVKREEVALAMPSEEIQIPAEPPRLNGFR